MYQLWPLSDPVLLLNFLPSTPHRQFCHSIQVPPCIANMCPWKTDKTKPKRIFDKTAHLVVSRFLNHKMQISLPSENANEGWLDSKMSSLMQGVQTQHTRSNLLGSKHHSGKIKASTKLQMLLAGSYSKPVGWRMTTAHTYLPAPVEDCSLTLGQRISVCWIMISADAIRAP